MFSNPRRSRALVTFACLIGFGGVGVGVYATWQDHQLRHTLYTNCQASHARWETRTALYAGEIDYAAGRIADFAAQRDDNPEFFDSLIAREEARQSLYRDALDSDPEPPCQSYLGARLTH